MNYDQKLQHLGGHIFLSKNNISNISNLPKALTFIMFTKANNLSEINYWFVSLLLEQSAGIIKQKSTQKKGNSADNTKNQEFLITINLKQKVFFTTLKNLEKKIFFLKDPKHIKISQFSKTGQKLILLKYCETYRIKRSADLQKTSSFYISDITLISKLKIKAIIQEVPAYYLNFFHELKK